MLRAPKDEQITPLSVVNFNTLLQNFSSSVSTEQTKKIRKKQNVEVFRGLEKEEVKTTE